MAKGKSRAARKKQREKTAEAAARGVALKPEESRAVRAAKEVQAAAEARRKERGHGSEGQGSAAIVRVLIGALIALAVIFALSQLRKAQSENEQTSGEATK